MSGFSLDSMIAQWASGSSAKKVPAPEEPAPTSVTPPVEVSPGTPQEAAEAISVALRASSGRRKKYTHWSQVARKVLKAQRLSAKRYDEVIAAGAEAGLFVLDEETLSFPILVPLDPVVEPEPEPEVRKVVRAPVPEPPQAPDDWDPVDTLPCGHSTHQRVPDPEVEKRHVVERIYEPGAGQCPACKAGTKGDPRFQEGKWRTPVLEKNRRSIEKAGTPGYPGLCADPSTGFYIGGLGNDCRHYHEGPERCLVHAPKKKKSA